MSRPYRFRTLGICLVLLLLATGAAYFWIVLRAKFEMGGASPGQATVGQVQNVKQRAMTQYCTGIVKTAQNTWLIGRLEEAIDRTPLPEGSVVLNTMVYGKQDTAAEKSEDFFSPWSRLREQPAETTFISRLGADGIFHEVARLQGTACLTVTPNDKALYLLTDLPRPDYQPAESGADSQAPELQQTVVLRSDDQGQNWQWLKSGWLPQVDELARSIKPQFYGVNAVWAWKNFSFGEDSPPPAAGDASGLFYSPDQGKTVESIKASAPLLVSLDEIRSKAPSDANWGSDDPNYGSISSHVSQTAPDKATIWVSQMFLYGPPDGPYLDTPLHVTTEAQLQRINGQWQMQKPKRLEGLSISHLQSTAAGKTIAVLDRDGQDESEVAELDASSNTWKMRGHLPSPFWPLPSSSGLRDFWVGEHVLLANTTSRYQVPQFLLMDGKGQISAESVFYSTDWGASWKKLAIAGYLGVLGFTPENNLVYWAKGNWYDSDEPQIYSFALHAATAK